MPDVIDGNDSAPVEAGIMSSAMEGYLSRLGVLSLAPLTCPFDPGYDPLTVESHLEQSAHLMAGLKISMACWLIAKETATRRKIAAARAHGVPTVTGGGPFEIALALGQLEHYLDLCADLGVSGIEAGEGFAVSSLNPHGIVQRARERGLSVQFELGAKHTGPINADTIDALTSRGQAWLDAGAQYVVVEARESAQSVGIFGDDAMFDPGLADLLARSFGLDVLVFEAPTKRSQFALLTHFGRSLRLSNVRLEEVLRVEIFRRGLHADAFSVPCLRPTPPFAQGSTASTAEVAAPSLDRGGSTHDD